MKAGPRRLLRVLPAPLPRVGWGGECGAVEAAAAGEATCCGWGARIDPPQAWGARGPARLRGERSDLPAPREEGRRLRGARATRSGSTAGSARAGPSPRLPGSLGACPEGGRLFLPQPRGARPPARPPAAVAGGSALSAQVLSAGRSGAVTRRPEGRDASGPRIPPQASPRGAWLWPVGPHPATPSATAPDLTPTCRGELAFRLGAPTALCSHLPGPCPSPI